MNPDLNQSPYHEQAPAPQQPQTPPIQTKKVSKRTKLAIWLMAGPTALLVVSFLIFGVINWVVASSIEANPTVTETCKDNPYYGNPSVNMYCPEMSETSPFGEPTALQTAINIATFLVAGIASLAFLPGLIIGIILLATKPQTPTRQL